MITSWPRDLPGPGMNARRLAERIAAMSGGRLTVQLYAAGELVPGLQVFDAVNAGVAEMGHSAAILLDRQDPGCRLLHHRSLRPDPARAHRLDRAWRRPGAVGRALRALRPQALHGRQLRHADGRLVPPRAQVPGRPERPQDPRRRPLRRASSRSWVRSPSSLPAGRDLPGAAERCRSTGSSSWAPTPTSLRASTRWPPSTTGRPSPSRTARPSASSAARLGTRCVASSRP